VAKRDHNIHSPSARRMSLIISQVDEYLFMSKHKLFELNKIIGRRIGSLKEEIEIASNVNLNPLYIIDLKDEIESLRWVTRIIKWIVHRAIDGRQQLGVTRMGLELEDTKKFEDMLNEKIRELEIELEDSFTAREKEVLINEINTLECVLGHLFNLKSGGDGDETQARELFETNNNFHIIDKIILSHNHSNN
jgi:hypothetical protein